MLKKNNNTTLGAQFETAEAALDVVDTLVPNTALRAAPGQSGAPVPSCLGGAFVARPGAQDARSARHVSIKASLQPQRAQNDSASSPPHARSPFEYPASRPHGGRLGQIRPNARPVA
ncbi:hypothetical protein MRX96_040840 [Rhipicephalus microplus]